jgi:histone H3/H4
MPKKDAKIVPGEARLRNHKAIPDRDTILNKGITKPVIKRFARRAQVRRIKGNVYGCTREILGSIGDDIMRRATIRTLAHKRKKVSERDMRHAIEECTSRHIYGTLIKHKAAKRVKGEKKKKQQKSEEGEKAASEEPMEVEEEEGEKEEKEKPKKGAKEKKKAAKPEKKKKEKEEKPKKSSKKKAEEGKKSKKKKSED